MTKNKLQERINRLGHPQRFSAPKSDSSESFKDAFVVAFVIFLILGFIASVLIFAEGDLGQAIEIVVCLLLIVTLISLPDGLICLGIGLGCGVVGGLIFGILAASKKHSKYIAKMNDYNKAVANDKKRVETEKTQILYLQKQQADIDEKITEIESVMKRFYALNVIYPKYRSFVPIITFYEYFESGRHTNLVDAYNKYEDELLHNTIIEKLDIVISKLDQIKQNQIALYDVIMESNSIAERLCQQTDSLLASNKAIEKNTAVAAYNAKIAADNSTINAYINICRF